jgi:transposase
MSLHPETIRIAHLAFPHGNIYLQLKDELVSIYQDEAFAHLFPQRGQWEVPPWQLAVVTIMQYMEGLAYLTDRLLMRSGAG